jgi:hypothetical protein
MDLPYVIRHDTSASPTIAQISAFQPDLQIVLSLYNDVYLTFLGGDYRCTLDAVYSLQTFVDPINHFENIAIIASPISVTTMRICWRHPNATACTHQTLPTPRPVILTFVDFGIHFVA